jgi:spore coat polysaccharide biosynthesis predicted glycosyltransferase SpsG
MDRTKRNKLARSVSIGGVGLAVISAILGVVSMFAKENIESKVDLVNSIKRDYPQVVRDTKTYEDQIKYFRQAKNYCGILTIGGAVISAGGMLAYEGD